MSEDRNARWEITLENRGVEAIRDLLRLSHGTGEGAVVRGLGQRPEEMPTRGYTEQWVARQDAEHELWRERREAKRDWWARGMAIAAVIVAILSWLFPYK
jgi:hypothetical protein